MYKLLFLILGLLGGSWAQAQSPSLSPVVIATAGGYLTSDKAQLSWTLGELAIETYALSGKPQITQGFHQTGLTIETIEDPAAPGIAAWVYPNPTANQLTVEVSVSLEPYELELWDTHGHLLQHHLPDAIPAAQHTMDLSGYPAGFYQLWLRNGDSQPIQVFKIIKHN